MERVKTPDIVCTKKIEISRKKCLTKGGMLGIISELSARDTNAKAVEGQAVGGVPCKLNNEKHEQTPWTI